eukprot:g5367.t1
MFYLPGLDQKPLHDREDFEWARTLELAMPTIRDEYFAALSSGSPAANPAGDYDTAKEQPDQMLHTGDWRWHSLITAGKKQQEFQQLCPTTTTILESIPDLQLDTPFSYAFFSALAPGARIAPHAAPCNIRLRCHLPLFVPDDAAPGACGMRIAGEEVEWKEGECLIFDDSYVHEVWYDAPASDAASDAASNTATPLPRVVLLFDVWHPGIHPQERREITDMFEEARRQGWLK